MIEEVNNYVDEDEEYTPVENQKIYELSDEDFEQIFHPFRIFYSLDLSNFREL